MAVTLFIVLCLVELALLAWSVATGSRGWKVRSWTRLLLFAAFVALVASGVVGWSLRWLALTVLLGLLAARGLAPQTPVALQRAPPPAAFWARSAVLRSVALALLYFLAVSPALLFPPYELPRATGPLSVGVARHTYRDASRPEQYGAGGGKMPGEMRQINVAFWYPNGASATETYPLVIFSHGGLGLDSSNESLYQELASHGYVVASLGHPYHAFWTRSEDGRLTFVNLAYMRALQEEDATAEPARSHAAYQEWMATRTGDINLALDAILERAAAGAEGVYALVDTRQVGVMGHSLGGAAALAMPRQRDDIRAVIALESPFLDDITGVEDGQFVWREAPYPVPALLIYSDSAWRNMEAWPQYARNVAYLRDATSPVSSWYLAGAGHFSLTDLGLASPLLVRLLEQAAPQRDAAAYLQDLNHICLAFFDLHLK